MSEIEQPLGRREAGQRGASHRLFVRDLELAGRIGVRAHERGRTQRLRLNLELVVATDDAPLADRYEKVVCYDEVVTAVRRLVAAGHVNLVETLAERIANLCLADPRVDAVKIRVEKLEVYADAASVGVEIERFRVRPRTNLSHST
jgi:dihydroneopterin aldolase